MNSSLFLKFTRDKHSSYQDSVVDPISKYNIDNSVKIMQPE